MASTGADMTTTDAVTEEEGVRRRDWIHIAAVSTAAVGAGGLIIPLVSQMGPSKDVLAASTTEVDVSAIEAGQSIKDVFRGQPLFIKRLTPQEIAAAKADDAAGLPDPQTLAERTNPANEAILVTLGVCTHLGCVPLGAAEGENKGDFGGYFCPCHGSHYDVAGRIRKGPAPKNLVVPEFEFKTEAVIRVG
ncbi:MAG: ubiquinol-cytochrome c reductase iron-sulfur subunit [Pseudomonadota bacterium]